VTEGGSVGEAGEDGGHLPLLGGQLADGLGEGLDVGCGRNLDMDFLAG
jgi:hypothetical protein